MRLLSVEFTRLRWRRAVLVLLAACVLIPTVIWVGLAWNTRAFSAADIRVAQQQVDREAQQPYVEAEVKRCLKHPNQYDADPNDLEASCRQSITPQIDQYLYRPQLDVAGEREGSGLAVITILVGLVMLIGTTFVGHDWASGSMSNQLLFEPRRIRVWAAKAVVVFLGGLVTSAVVLAAYWGAVWLLAGSRDLQATGHQWELIRNSALRGTFLVALAGVGGYALTMLFRSTVATLGVLFAFTVGGSLIVLSVLGDEGQRWLPPTNFAAVLLNGYDYYSSSAEQVCTNFGDGFTECSGMAHLSLTHGVVYLLVLVIVAVALSVWSFRSRDIP